MKTKKLQLRKETMAMLDDPQMHGINGGGAPGNPGATDTCKDTCKDTCRATCVANCTATIQFTCEGFTCQTGGACDANSRQTCGTCAATCGQKCGGGSGYPGLPDDTDTIKCGYTGGGTVPPGGVTC